MLVFPSSRGGEAATIKKRPHSEAGADEVVRIFSDHPGRAFLTFDGASTPPPEEGNNSGFAISSLGNRTPWAEVVSRAAQSENAFGNGTSS